MAKKIGSKDGKTVIIPDREVPLTRGTPTAYVNMFDRGPYDTRTAKPAEALDQGLLDEYGISLSKSSGGYRLNVSPQNASRLNRANIPSAQFNMPSSTYRINRTMNAMRGGAKYNVFDTESIGIRGTNNFALTEIALYGNQGQAEVYINPFDGKKFKGATNESAMFVKNAIRRVKEDLPLSKDEHLALRGLLKYGMANKGKFLTANEYTNLKPLIRNVEYGAEWLSRHGQTKDNALTYLKSFMENKRDHYFVGYNSESFDIPALKEFFGAQKFNEVFRPLEQNHFDMFQMVKNSRMDHFLGTENAKLETILNKLGLMQGAQAHTALEDTKSTFGFMEAMLNPFNPSVQLSQKYRTRLSRVSRIMGAQMTKAEAHLQANIRNPKLATQSLFSAAGLDTSTELISVKGLKAATSDFVIDLSNGTRMSGDNSVFRGISYNLGGLFETKDGKFGVVAYGKERNIASVIVRDTEAALQQAINEAMIPKELAQRMGYDGTVKVGSKKYAQWEFDSALRQYNRMFEVNNYGLAKKMYDSVNSKGEIIGTGLSDTQKMALKIFGPRMASEKAYITSVMSAIDGSPLNEFQKSLALNQYMTAFGENNANLDQNVLTRSIAILDPKTGSVGTLDGVSAKRVEIQAGNKLQIEKSINRILSNAVGRNRTAGGINTRNYYLDQIMNDLESRGIVTFDDVIRSSNNLQDKVRSVSDAIYGLDSNRFNTQVSVRNPIGRAGRRKKPAQELIDRAISMAGGVKTVDLRETFYANEDMATFFDARSFSKINEVSSSVRGSFNTFTNKLAKNLGSNFGMAIMPTLRGTDTVGYSFAIFDRSYTEPNAIFTGSKIVSNESLIQLPILTKRGTIITGNKERIAGLRIKEDGGLESSYDYMMREINRYIPTFKDILGKNGKSEAIAWLQKKINETTDPLSAVSKRVLYNDQSGFSVTGTVSDFLKGNSVNAEEYIRNLVNNRYGKETNPLKAQYMAMRDAVSELKGLSITGKDSDVSSMIFNRVNVQDFSAFGRMIQPLRSNMTQHQNYYALKKTAINGMAATYTRLTTTGSAEKAMGTIGRHLSGITARGTIANNIEIQNAINAALNDPTVPKHVKDELMNKRSMLSTYENMSIMSQDLADTLGSQYTRYLPVDAKFKEQAEKLIGQSFKPDEVMIRDPRAKNNLHYKGEYGTTATVSELVAQADGSYKLRLDVAKPFMSGGKFTSMAGEKATATILSREAYQAIDKSGGLYMFSPNIPKHGDIGAFIEGLVGNKLYDLNMTSGEKAIRQFASQLNALMYSGAREKMAKEAIEVEHVDGFFRFNIAEDAILKGQGSLLDENAKKLSQLLLRGKGSINVMSEVRAAKVDETFAIHGPYSKDGVKYSFREVLALRAQNLGAVADYVQGEFGVNSGATSSRLSNAWKAAQDVSGVKRITDSLPEFAIGNGIEDVVRDTGIVSYKNSIFKPTGMASDQLYKLNLPVALEASDFLGWGSNHPEGKLTLAKAFEKGNMTGIDSLTVLTSDLGKYHPMVNGQQVTRYSIGGDDSITNALADVERSIMSINDLAADATDDVRRDARRRLAYSVNKYAEAASYAVSGSHGETKDAFTANLKRSAYVKLQGINPTEFTRSGSALWEAGVRENTVVISKELAGQMMGRSYVHDLTKGASLVNGIYQTEELYGLGLRYPNINRQSVQGLRVMIGDAETLGLNTKAAYMTPGTVKKLAGDFDGDNVTISMLLDEENTKGARQAVERMWQATYAKESQDQLKEYYNNKIGSKLGMTSAREGLADIISGGAIRDIDSLTTETVLNSKIGAKMFTGYVTNTATRMMSSAASIYGVTSDQYRLLEDTISTPLQQDIISSKHGTNTIMSVFEVIDTINGRSNNYGQLRNALIDPAKASEEDIAKIDRGINILRDIHTKTARTHSLNVATSSTGEKALSSLLGSGTLLDDELAETVLGKIDTTAERAKLLRDQMNEEAYQSIMNEMKDTYSKVEEHTQFNLKFNKKTAIVAAGVAAGLYAFGTVRGMLDVGDARMQPEEDKAPASDGYYIPGGGETHRAPIAPISMMGSGYEGMQINIKAYNSKGGTDPEYLNEAIASSMKNQIAVPVTIKHSVSDNRSDMNKQDVEGILSQAIRGY